MSRLKLEEFDLDAPRPAAGAAAPGTPAPDEDAQLEAFENGYKAGWEDATKSQADNFDNVSLELGRNLQDLSFTFFEARSQVIRDMRPLLEELVSKTLPMMAAENLPALVVEKVMEIVESEATSRVVIKISPTNQRVLEKLLGTQNHLEIQTVPEPALGDGQALIGFAGQEQQINLNEVLELAAKKVSGFFEQNEKVG